MEGSTNIFIGDWLSNPALKEQKLLSFLKNYKEHIGSEGFIIYPRKNGEEKQIIIVGATPIAVLYGSYELLERMGIGFNLGGDTVHKTTDFKMPSEMIIKKPAFSIRGSLPWYNFFNSPTTWNMKDFMSFFDNMIKLKNNFVG